MLKKLLQAVLGITLAFSALCGSASAETVLAGAGATFPHPLYSKWFRDYQAEDPGVSFSYEAQGSGEGIRRILAREESLLRDVWGYHFVDDSRTVDTHITRLRTKMGKAGDLIKTVRGFGYKLDVDSD